MCLFLFEGLSGGCSSGASNSSSFFCCWSHIESSSFLFRVIRWEIFLRLREIGQAGGYPRLTSLSIKTPPQRRAEAPGLVCPGFPDSFSSWSTMEFSKSTKTLTERAHNDLLKDHKVLKWQDRGVCRFLWKGCSYHVIAEKKNSIPLFDVDSSTLPFLVEEG